MAPDIPSDSEAIIKEGDRLMTDEQEISEALQGEGEETPVGFLMGTPWVTFCHTILVPMYTVPVMGMGTTQPVITAGSHETHSVGGTHGFFIRGSKMVYQNYKIPVLDKLLNVLNL